MASICERAQNDGASAACDILRGVLAATARSVTIFRVPADAGSDERCLWPCLAPCFTSPFFKTIQSLSWVAGRNMTRFVSFYIPVSLSTTNSCTGRLSTPGGHKTSWLRRRLWQIYFPRRGGSYMGRSGRCPLWRDDTRYACAFRHLPNDHNISLQSRTLMWSPTVMGMTWRMVPDVRMVMRSSRGIL